MPATAPDPANDVGPFGVVSARPAESALPVTGSPTRSSLVKNVRLPTDVLLPRTVGSPLLTARESIGIRTPIDALPPRKVFSIPSISRYAWRPVTLEPRRRLRAP